MQTRKSNYYFIRSRTGDELEWLRPDSIPPSLPRPIIVYSSPFDPLTVGDMRGLFDARTLAGKGTVIAALESYSSPSLLTPIERAAQLAYMPIDFLTEVESPASLEALLSSMAPNYWVTVPQNRHSCPAVRKALIRPSSINTLTLIDRVKRLLNERS